MGSCICKGMPTVVISRENLQRAIAGAIEEDRVRVLEQLFENYMSKALLPYAMPVLDIDDPLLHVQGIDLNPLAYAFRLGRVEIAQFLLEKAKCSLQKLYTTFRQVGKTPLDILCEHGHIDLLHYFLPKHLKRPVEESPLVSYEDSYEQLSIFADNTRPAKVKNYRGLGFTFTAVQRAVQHGQIEIVRYIVSFAQEQGWPRELDIHAEDEKTGENCALISCRVGDMQIVRLLFEECKADFHKLNKRGESALQLAVVGAKKHKTGKHMEVVKYLVERVKVDITYLYEETLLMSEDKAITQYLEQKLRSVGVVISKEKVDAENVVSHEKVVRPIDPELESRILNAGSNFLLRDIFREEFADKSYISSIEDQSVTPISEISRIIPTPGAHTPVPSDSVA